MKWLIIGTYRGESEVIDETTKGKEYADYLVREYQLAYGSEWRVFKSRQRRGN